MKEQVHVIERLAKGTKCKDCVSFRECARDATLPAFETEQAALCKGFAPRKPQTNADRIRSLSDEELAFRFGEMAFQGVYLWCDWHCKRESEFHVCEKCILDWLRQPVKDGDNDGE